MDINIFQNREKITASAKVVADDPRMEEYIKAILKESFDIADRDGDVTVVCVEKNAKAVNGPCIYIGTCPESLPPDSAVLSRPFLMEDLPRTCLEVLEGNKTSSGSFALDEKRSLAFYKDRRVSLTGRECQLFSLLLSRMGECVLREEIEKALWNGENTGNSADVYVCFLRKKLESIAGEGVLLSVRGRGYMLREP